MSDSPASTPRHVVVMGVSGSGKSTVGALLADKLGLPYRDGDDLHPQANIDKMAGGIPLNDDDRWPWLAEVGQWLADRPAGGIIGCSSLKRSYRDAIRAAAPDSVFVHVHGEYDLLHQRMNDRPGHFMPASMLDSQMSTLEKLEEDEVGHTFDIVDTPSDIVDDAADWLTSIGTSD